MSPLRPLSLIPRIEEVAASGDNSVTFVNGDTYDTIGWGELHRDAQLAAARLQSLGIGPGDRVGVLGPTNRALVTALQAVWLTGAALVMMPLPMRLGGREQFVVQTRDRMRKSSSALMLIDPGLVDFFGHETGDPQMLGLDEFVRSDWVAEGQAHSSAWIRPELDPDTLAVVQFTSGSTSDPKGVMLTHRSICNNLDGAWTSASLTSRDRMVSWLPLYHDMGLIGMLSIPMVQGCSLVQGAPQDFLARPIRWARWISDFGGSVTAGPNFAFALGARALRRSGEQLDLSSLEILLNGAEPVDTEVFREFLSAGERFGLDPSSAFPAFGMAEVCIAGTFPPRGRGLVTDVVDRGTLEEAGLARPCDPMSASAVEFASLGLAVDGLKIQIVNPESGELCGEREVGELRIAGNAVTSGYFHDEVATAEAFDGEWLRTGDLGYLVNNELVVCGRLSDVIIVGGRNLHPQDIERAAGAVDGVRTGNVIAFGVPGRQGAQSIVVVAEVRETATEMIRREITRAVTESVGVPPKKIVLVVAGTVPKTSSGKLQRSLCRLRYQRGEFSE